MSLRKEGRTCQPGSCTAEVPNTSDCLVFQKEANTFCGQVQDEMGLCIVVGWEAGGAGGSYTICDAQVLLIFINPCTKKRERKSKRETKNEKKKKKKGKGRKIGDFLRSVFCLCLLFNMVFTSIWQTELFS